MPWGIQSLVRAHFPVYRGIFSLFTHMVEREQEDSQDLFCKGTNPIHGSSTRMTWSSSNSPTSGHHHTGSLVSTYMCIWGGCRAENPVHCNTSINISHRKGGLIFEKVKCKEGQPRARENLEQVFWGLQLIWFVPIKKGHSAIYI